MFVESLLLFFLQSQPNADFRPMREIDPYALCSCANKPEGEEVAFTGVVTDAEMTLGADGRSAKERQATVFRILKGSSEKVPDPAKVWHVTNPSKCGVTFDYGKRYDVVAVRKENGELETSYCVMPDGKNKK
ncbi:MAG TPA: hypothetical protein PKM48_00635 [Parvularculaceae bacterium]|nr:hypothetical protein [Parvularculaceae bacterium]HNS86591.1 hypothetical protein [Parvularculaceae bacterium]